MSGGSYQNSGLSRFGGQPGMFGGYQPRPYTPMIFAPPQMGARPGYGQPGTAGGPPMSIFPQQPMGGGYGGPGGIGGGPGGSSSTAGQAAGIAANGIMGGIPGLVAGLIGAANSGASVNGAAANAAAMGDPIAMAHAMSQEGVSSAQGPANDASGVNAEGGAPAGVGPGDVGDTANSQGPANDAEGANDGGGGAGGAGGK